MVGGVGDVREGLGNGSCWRGPMEQESLRKTNGERFIKGIYSHDGYVFLRIGIRRSRKTFFNDREEQVCWSKSKDMDQRQMLCLKRKGGFSYE